MHNIMRKQRGKVRTITNTDKLRRDSSLKKEDLMVAQSLPGMQHCFQPSRECGRAGTN
jgi:hypothetical protein